MAIVNGLKKSRARGYLALTLFFLPVSCGGVRYQVLRDNVYARRDPGGGGSSGDVTRKKHAGRYKVGKPYRIFGKEYRPSEDRTYREIGVASWYGEDFQNRRTANGDIFDMDAMTAAHRTLPMPSVVRVANLENGKSVLVVVNDRGPFVDDRIIDLSRGAARKLGFLEKGTARVRVEFREKETRKLLEFSGLI
jgi:rare lipoprotein A